MKNNKKIIKNKVIYLFDSTVTKESLHIKIHKKIIFSKINHNLHKFYWYFTTIRVLKIEKNKKLKLI